MKLWGWWGRRLEVLLRKDMVEKELNEEMQFHLDMEIRQHIACGMTESEARRRAMIDFGGVERFKEEVRDVRGARLLDDMLQDMRVASRSLPKQPAFLIAVLLTLAIGIGGNVAVFGVYDATLLRALPFESPDDLVFGRVSYNGEIGNTVSAPDYFDYREQVASLSSLGAITPFAVEATLTGAGDTDRIRTPFVSTNLFSTLGVDPMLGRHFLAEEGEPGAAPVVMLSHDLWERRFGADPSVVGSSINLNGGPYTVVGVMPAGFHFLIDGQVWVAMQRGGAFAGARQFHNWVLVGRLAPGVSTVTAQAEVDLISSQLAEAYPSTNADKGLNLTPLGEALIEGYTRTLTLLLAAVVTLLLVAAANVAGLMLARGSARQAEMAVRSAMGAGRGRLARQLMAENALLAGAAAVLGVGLAAWLQRALVTVLPVDTLGPISAELSLRMVGVAVGITALTVVLFGGLPALRAGGSDPAGNLRSGKRTSSSREATSARSLLVVGQVSMTVVLLVVSGLLVRSFATVQNVDPGFDPEGILTARIQFPAEKYSDAAARAQAYEALRGRVSEASGVSAASLISHLPIRDQGGDVRVAPPEAWGAEGVFGRLALNRSIFPGYFEMMGIPIRLGRDVSLEDDGTTPPVIILSEALAKSLFPEGSPLGRAVGIDGGGDEPRLLEVVGVVGDVTSQRREYGSEFTMYLPYGQSGASAMTLAVRARGDAAALTPALRAILAGVDPDVPLADVATMDDIMSRAVSDRLVVSVVVGAFATVALLLAGVGLYGVLAYRVAGRLREIGVRIALGATVTSVSNSVLRSGMLLIGAGLAVGWIGALVASRFVSGMLFGVEATDPVTYIAVTLFLGVVAALACVIPARRAAHVDPVDAFRSD
jgi:predicted permease